MSNPNIIPAVPLGDDSLPEETDDLGTFDEGEPLDPDVDGDRVDSAEADMQAATEGTKDGDVDRG